MPIAHSKITAQGQISVPTEIRKTLGVGPGSVLEWNQRDNEIVVRRAGRYSTAEVHQALFPKALPAHKDSNVKVGIRLYMRKRQASD